MRFWRFPPLSSSRRSASTRISTRSGSTSATSATPAPRKSPRTRLPSRPFSPTPTGACTAPRRERPPISSHGMRASTRCSRSESSHPPRACTTRSWRGRTASSTSEQVWARSEPCASRATCRRAAAPSRRSYGRTSSRTTPPTRADTSTPMTRPRVTTPSISRARPPASSTWASPCRATRSTR